MCVSSFQGAALDPPKGLRPSGHPFRDLGCVFFLGLARVLIRAILTLVFRALMARATGLRGRGVLATRALAQLPYGRLASRILDFFFGVARGGPILRMGTGSCRAKGSLALPSPFTGKVAPRLRGDG